MISFKTTFIGYTAFLFHSSNSEQDINLTDYHYSWPSNKIYVAYSMYPAFLFRPSIYVMLKVGIGIILELSWTK